MNKQPRAYFNIYEYTPTYSCIAFVDKVKKTAD